MADESARYTSRRLPVELVYYEYFDSIKTAFEREKQIQGWSRKEKEALVKSRHEELPAMAKKVFR